MNRQDYVQRRRYEYPKAKEDFLRNVAPYDQKLPRETRMYLLEQIQRGDEKMKVPPGMNVGHRVGLINGGTNEMGNLRLEPAKWNMARGPREAKIAREYAKKNQ